MSESATRRWTAIDALALAAVGIAVAIAGWWLLRVTAVQPPPEPPAALAPPPTAAPAATEAPEAPPPPTSRVDPEWVTRVAAEAGIPRRALLAYASAALELSSERPECHLGWNTLAAIGWVETRHGGHDGAALGDDGTTSPAIRGPRLRGGGASGPADTDGGKLDGDAEWDRAMGPLQFIPDSWRRWAADGNGDGAKDPDQIDDAALAAARYLCVSGDLALPDRWRAAIHSYNHLDSYVDQVARVANGYADAAR